MPDSYPDAPRVHPPVAEPAGVRLPPGRGRRTERMPRPGRIVLIVVAIAVTLVAVVAAWAIRRTYDDDRHDAVNGLARLAYESAADSGQYVRGRLDVLTTYATRPSFALGDVDAARSDLAAFPADQLMLEGGVAWFDPNGERLASARDPDGPTSPELVAFVRDVVAGGPAVSAALTTGELDGRVVALGVPSRGVDGRVNGALVAGMPLEWLRSVADALDASRGATTFIYDRAGELIVGDAGSGGAPAPPDLAALPESISRNTVVYAGLSSQVDPAGNGNRVLGYATDTGLTGWTTLQVRPSADVFADARRTVLRSSAALTAAVIAVLALAVMTARRLDRLARRAQAAEDAAGVERARAEADERNLRLALEATATGWFQWEPGTAELRWSDTASSLVDPGGHPPGVPRSVDDALGIVHADDREEIRRRLAEAVTTATQVEVEFRIATDDDQPRYAWLHLAPVPDEAGRPLRMVGLVRDVTLRRRAELEVAQAAARERDVARLLQRSLLPERLPVLEGLRLVARYRAAGPDTVVGGDFYDVTVLDDGSHSIVIGDVCGHGVEAASTTSLARHTLRAAARHTSDPADDLHWLHDALVRASGHGFITCAALRGRVIGGRYEFDLALGGHPMPLLVRDGTVRPLGEPGTLLGVVDPSFRTVHHVLSDGDRIVLYTDGLTDSVVPRLDDDGLLALVRDLADLPLEEFADGLLRRFEPVAGTRHDDTALVIVEVGGPPV